jgi:hypothetical protein
MLSNYSYMSLPKGMSPTVQISSSVVSSRIIGVDCVQAYLLSRLGSIALMRVTLAVNQFYQ